MVVCPFCTILIFLNFYYKNYIGIVNCTND